MCANECVCWGRGVLKKRRGIRTVPCLVFSYKNMRLTIWSFIFSKYYVGILKRKGDGWEKTTLGTSVPSLKKYTKHYLKFNFFSNILCYYFRGYVYVLSEILRNVYTQSDDVTRYKKGLKSEASKYLCLRSKSQICPTSQTLVESLQALFVICKPIFPVYLKSV